MFCNSYHLYMRAKYYRGHAYQLHFLRTTRKSIPVQSEATQKDLRPLHRSIRRGESKSAVFIFVWTLFGKLFWKKKIKMYHTKNRHNRFRFFLSRTVCTYVRSLRFVVHGPYDLFRNWFFVWVYRGSKSSSCIPKAWESDFILKDVGQAKTLKYSWIGLRLQAGLTLAFLLWLSKFKTKTIFGFLSPKYTGHVFWIFPKSRKTSSYNWKWCFWQF